MGEGLLGHGLPYGLGDRHRARAVRGRKHHREFLAAIARGEIGRTLRLLGDHARHSAQAAVTGLMAPDVGFSDDDRADGIPVALIFGLLSPEQAGAGHFHALAAISRMMRDERMHAALGEAPGAEALYGLLANVIDRDAA